MKSWWYTLAARERLWVIFGSLLILVTLIWFYGLKPLIQYKTELTQLQIDIKADRAQIEIIAPDLLQAQQDLAPDPTRNEKLQYLIDPLLKRYQLDRSDVLISQSENANGSVSLRLQKASFDQVMEMLGALELHHHAYASQFNITPSANGTGLINANLTLMR